MAKCARRIILQLYTFTYYHKMEWLARWCFNRWLDTLPSGERKAFLAFWREHGEWKGLD